MFILRQRVFLKCKDFQFTINSYIENDYRKTSLQVNMLIWIVHACVDGYLHLHVCVY